MFKEFDEVPKHTEVHYFSESWLESFMPAYMVDPARLYLLSRDVSADQMVMYNIRYDMSRNAVCFPIRDFDGGLVGLRGRLITPGDGPKHYNYKTGFGGHNPYHWFGEDRVNLSSPVVMVESTFDCVSVGRVYSNVVAPLSTGISKHQAKRMAAAVEIITLFDNGVGGDKARNIVSKFFSSSVITHLKPPANRDDPGEMTEAEIRSALSKVLPEDLLI